MIDYKYHIASLVAVFLSLGIGILVGSTLLGNDSLIEYQKQITNSLESQLHTLRESNEELQIKASEMELDANIHRQFEKQVLPILAENQLAEKKFAVVQLNSVGFPPEITTVIQSAGGTVVSVTLAHDIGDKKKVIVDCQENLGWTIQTGDELYKNLAEEIALYMADGSNGTVIDYLATKELLKTEGEYGVPLDGIIIVGGSYQEKDRNLRLDIALIDSFNELGIPVVGVEEFDVAASSMKEYQLKHISTVDNIDTVPGQLALVLLLAGQQGNYGFKSTAQQIMPPWPEPKIEVEQETETQAEIDTAPETETGN